MFSESFERVTPPLAIHLLLQKDIGNNPHQHDFLTFKPEFLSGKMEVGKPNTTVLLGQLRPIDPNSQHIFFCKHCFIILQICQKPSPFSPLSEGNPISTTCPAAKVHHFHWEQQPDSSLEFNFGKNTLHVTSNSTITCCKCEYSLEATFKIPPLSTLAIQTLRQVTDIGDSYMGSLSLVSSILLTALYDSPKPLRVTAESFKRNFKDRKRAIGFFESLGYNSEGDLLIPDSSKWPGSFVLAHAWTQIQLERLQHISLLELPQEPLRNYFISAKTTLLKIFGGSYNKETKFGTVDPFDLSPQDLTSAYTQLGCVRDMSDETIWETFRTLQGDNPQQMTSYFDHVIEVAEERNTDFLISEVAKAKSQGEYSLRDVKKALEHFELAESATEIDEDEVLSRFQTLMAMNPDDIGEHRSNLKLLGIFFGSKAIEKYLETGVMLSQNNANVPVGLENIGNTCYLNSLLQYYFSIKYLRKEIISASSDMETLDYDMDEEPIQLKIDDREINRKEIILARFFVKHLCDLFIKLETDKPGSYISPNRDLAKIALGNMNLLQTETQPVHLSSKRRLSYYTQSEKTCSPFSNETNDSLLSIEKSQVHEDCQSMSPDLILHDSTASAIAALPKPEDQPSLTLQEETDSKSSPENIRKKSRANSPEQLLFMDTPESNVLVNRESSDVASKLSFIDSSNGPKNHSQNESTENMKLLSPIKDNLTTFTANNELELGSQQDVSECMDHIMWQLEKAFVSQASNSSTAMSSSENIIKKLFYGTTHQNLKYFDATTSKEINSVKKEAFSQLIINVDKTTDIYEALDTYFSSSQVELEGTEASRELFIDHLPPFLQIQFQRVQFDRQTLQVYKSNAFMKLYNRIYLDRYINHDDLGPETKAKLDALGEQARQLKLSNVDPIHKDQAEAMKKVCVSLINNLKEKSIALNIDTLEVKVQEMELNGNQDTATRATKISHTIEILEEQVRELEDNIEEKNELELREKLADLYSKNLKLEYSLHAVFIHKGNAEYGHYWVYIRNWMEDKWFKYDDETVTHVDDSEIFQNTTNSNANPYYVIYADTSQIEALKERL